ncbi:polysaccharide biosynthesis/export family protein [Sphingobium sp. B2]|uniref:polysaccharide biosynthesis/export family protein n=1 Tax=Sphingobium sp. B2 TaxID=2583228 RepID=UPI0021BDAC5F|nr:polysaccharide biosynthesis/export family protein [Sphingobium sp. B2]
MKSRCFMMGLGATILLSACASPGLEHADPNTLTVVERGGLPAPETAEGQTGERPYLIGPFDKLHLAVFAIPELAAMEVQVDSSGRVSIPLVGIIHVAGLTPLQMEEQVKDGLRGRYLRDPQVAVNLVEAVSQVVTVTGEVKNPGTFPVVGRMTLLQSIALAKGQTDIADLRQVVIFRTVQNTKYAALYDVRAIMAGRYSDPEIYASDFVIVGNSRARQIFKDVISSAPLWITPLVVALGRK